LISALGLLPDVRRAMTTDLKRAGSFLYVIGETRGELGASHLGLIGGHVRAQHQVAPRPVPGAAERFRRLHKAVGQGLVLACHDCSEGGLAVALAEMCLGGRLGAEIELMRVPRDPYNAYAADDAILFSESLSRFIVEVSPEMARSFEACMDGVVYACLGVTGGDRMRINGRDVLGEPLVDLPVRALESAWRGHLSVYALEDRSTAPPKVGDAGAYTAITTHTTRPRVLILHANGTNRDGDAAVACRLAGGAPEIVHVNQLLSGERDLLAYHMLVIPGGFSYGDDLGAGVLWASDLQYLFGDVVKRFVEDGRPVLGICNGFQALVKSGILPGPPFSRSASHGDQASRDVTLTYNARASFECRWVYLAPQSGSSSLFTRGLDAPIYCPVAHGEGRVVARDEAATASLLGQGLAPLTYVLADGTPAAYPANPNGSAANIAALSNAAGNVLGLMPHPENHVFPWQHPRWRRGEKGLDGLRLFKNGIKSA
ncbi:MAG: phosphoribosylformylglycinamidine synthase subunit PurQ, partial [Candidatus Promineifilaceae bacterium]